MTGLSAALREGLLHNGLRRGILPLHGFELSKRRRREQCFERGRVRQYRLTNGTLKAKGTIKLPSAFRATGAALAKLEAEGPQHLVFVDARHHLRVYRGSEELWKSPSSVGGSYTYGEVEQTITRGDVITQSFFFEPIPAAVDLDGDGIDAGGFDCGRHRERLVEAGRADHPLPEPIPVRGHARQGVRLQKSPWPNQPIKARSLG